MNTLDDLFNKIDLIRDNIKHHNRFFLNECGSGWVCILEIWMSSDTGIQDIYYSTRCATRKEALEKLIEKYKNGEEGDK